MEPAALNSIGAITHTARHSKSVADRVVLATCWEVSGAGSIVTSARQGEGGLVQHGELLMWCYKSSTAAQGQHGTRVLITNANVKQIASNHFGSQTSQSPVYRE